MQNIQHINVIYKADILLIVLLEVITGRGMIQAIIHITITKRIEIQEMRPPPPKKKKFVSNKRNKPPSLEFIDDMKYAERGRYWEERYKNTHYCITKS